MKKTTFVRNFSSAVLAATLLCATPPARAEADADQVPASVEAERAALDAKFTAILTEECSARLCTPVGCEISGFRTLDQKQNSSLPGLDLGDDQPASLQYRLSSARCDFTYEPVLAPDAIANLRERLQEKIRQAGVSLSVTARKLNPASPSLREGPKDAVTPVAPPPSPWAPLLAGLPQLALIAAVTFGLIALIWAFRRVGKPKPKIEVLPEVLSEAPAVSEDPLLKEVAVEKAALAETFRAHPERATLTFEPLVREAMRGQKDDPPNDLARVLNEFGSAPLAALASRLEYRDVFARIRQSYATTSVPEESAGERLAFLAKISRLLELSRLEVGERSLEEELFFLRELTPDEFLALAGPLEATELMMLLVFAPEGLRARVLQTQDDAFRDAFSHYLLGRDRIAEREVRLLAQALRERFARQHAEIKNAMPAKLPLLEQLMNTLDGASRRQLVSRLKSESPALFEQLISQTLLEKALSRVPAAALNDVFLALDPDEAAAYLGSHPDRAAVLARLKGPLAQSVESRLKARYGFGLDLDFVEGDAGLAESARRKVNSALKEKSARGELNLRSLNEAAVEPSLA